MNEIKYFPGQPCSFRYTSYNEKDIRNEKVIVFEVHNIKYVLGTVINKSGVIPFYENFTGNIFMKMKFASDVGFKNTENFKNYDDDMSKLPSKGFYFSNGKTKLYLDVDENGTIWLTDICFNEKKLHEQLRKININSVNFKKQIKG